MFYSQRIVAFQQTQQIGHYWDLLMIMMKNMIMISDIVKVLWPSMHVRLNKKDHLISQ